MRRLFFVASLVGALFIFGFSAGGATGATPSNDNFATATTVPSLPFSDSGSNVGATNEAGEPTFNSISNTVWYSFTPSAAGVVKLTVSADYMDVFNVYRADGADLGGLTWLAGSLWYSGQTTFVAQTGATYYIQIGSYDTYYGSGTFTLNLSLVPPPANDGFADAAPVTAVPFEDTQDMTGATTETGEPLAGSSINPFVHTVWYRFVPTTSGTYSTWPQALYGAEADVYTGTTLSDLTRIASSAGGMAGGTFQATAGTTYWLQVGTYNPTTVTLRVAETPPPTALFAITTSNPSVFDACGFYNMSNDPGGMTMTARWDFGDGTDATEWNPSHQYKVDGDYPVTLAVTAADGRTSSVTNTYHVETHDVAIVSFVVPSKGRVGKAAVINVGVGNTRYPETVYVSLAKLTPQGSVVTDTQTATVPVMSAKKSVNFMFSYTFTNDDLAAGKVTFQATANITSSDAAPGDNTTIAPATLVTK